MCRYSARICRGLGVGGWGLDTWRLTKPSQVTCLINNHTYIPTYRPVLDYYVKKIGFYFSLPTIVYACTTIVYRRYPFLELTVNMQEIVNF